MEHFLSFLNEIWTIIQSSSIYTLVGFFIAGLLHELINPELINSQIGKNNIRSAFVASLIGIPLPLCSCSVIPVAMELRQKGASKSAVTSFLISVPETGIDSIGMTYSLMDPLMTVLRPIAAFITALIAGSIQSFIPDEVETKLNKNTGSVPSCCSASQKSKTKFNLMRAIKYGYGNLLGSIAKYLWIGFIISGMISYLIPDHFFEQYFYWEYGSIILIILISLPIYVCATASTPIAAVLIMKGLSPGAALVFLLAGPATNVATILVIKKLLGKISLTIYLISLFVCSFLMGILVNYLYNFFKIDLKDFISSSIHNHHSSYLSILTGIIFLLLIITHLAKPYFRLLNKS